MSRFIDCFPDGIIYKCYEVNQSETEEIFTDKNTVDLFDSVLIDRLADFELNNSTMNCFNRFNDSDLFLEEIAKKIILMCYSNWKTIKVNLEKEYNVFDIGRSNTETLQELTDREIENEDTNEHTVNAFNSESDVKDSGRTSNRTETNKNERSYTKERVTTGSVLKHSDILKSENEFRLQYNFFDLLVKDIRKNLLKQVY